MARYWVPHDETVWTVAEQVSADTFVVDGIRRVFPTAEFEEVHEGDTHGIPQLADLARIHEAAVLSTLRVRYLRSEIYTYAGNALVAMNPHKRLAIYTPAIVDRYASNEENAPPHIFAIAQRALYAMQAEEKSQSVLVLGDAGSGKTESAKLVLQYLAQRSAQSRTGSADIDVRLLRCQIVLEAFGHAKTSENKNSSRFGKWIEVGYSADRRSITAAKIHDILLETTQRNFHIFALLAEGARQHHPYVENGDPMPAQDLPVTYEELVGALAGLQFSEDDIKALFAVASGVHLLHSADNAVERIEQAARLWGVDAEKICTCLRDELEGTQLAQWMYARLFRYVVRRINGALGGICSEPTIGVLDFAGFERFPTNSLEQLFVNWSAEKVQQVMNSVLKYEIHETRLESSQTQTVMAASLPNNDLVLQLFEGTHPPGLLALLEEEATAGNASDDAFLTKATSMFAKHPRYTNASVGFTIDHSSGKVTYAVDGFMETNRTLRSQQQLEALFADSNKPTVQEMVSAFGSTRTLSRDLKLHRPSESRALRAKNDLRMLLANIDSLPPHIVHCIAIKLDWHAVKDQVKVAILDVLHVRRRGYPLRLPFDEFFCRYILLLPRRARGSRRKPFPMMRHHKSRAVYNNAAAQRGLDELAHALELTGFALQPRDFVVGKSKILCTDRAHRVLEDARHHALQPIVILIQKVYRGFKWRAQMKLARELFRHLNDIISRYSSMPLWFANREAIQEELRFCNEVVGKASELLVDLPNLSTGKRARHRLFQIGEVYADLQQCLQSYDVAFLHQTLARAEDLSNMKFELIPRVEDRVEKLHVQMPLVIALQHIHEDLDPEEMAELLDAAITCIENASLASNPDQWLVPHAAALYKQAKTKLADMDTLPCVRSQSVDAYDLVSWTLDFDKRVPIPVCTPASASTCDLEPLTVTEGTRFYSLTPDACPPTTPVTPMCAAVRRRATMVSYDVHDQWHDASMLPRRQRSEHNIGRKTVTGMVIEDQLEIEKKLRQAAYEYDVMEMKRLIGDASRQGLDPRARFSDLVFFFLALQTSACIRNLLRRTLDEPSSCQRTVRLYCLSKQAEVLGMPEQKMVFEELRKIEGSGQEIALNDIYQLKNHPMLRLPGVAIATFSPSEENSMLAHQTQPLRVSILTFNERPVIKEQLNQLACQCFRNILGYCGDLPSLYPEALVYELLANIHAYPMLRDEVYCQFMKQLRCNPSTYSEQRCWQFLLFVIRHVRPSKYFEPYVHRFIEVYPTDMAAECLSELLKHSRRKTSSGLKEYINLPRKSDDTVTHQIRAEMDHLQQRLKEIVQQPPCYEESRLWGDGRAHDYVDTDEKPFLEPRALERFTYGVSARSTSLLDDVVEWMTCVRCRFRSKSPQVSEIWKPLCVSERKSSLASPWRPTGRGKKLTVSFNEGFGTLASTLLEDKSLHGLESCSSVSSHEDIFQSMHGIGNSQPHCGNEVDSEDRPVRRADEGKVDVGDAVESDLGNEESLRSRPVSTLAGA